MTRLSRAWGSLELDQRIAAIAAMALLITMFLPWYGLQSQNPKTRTLETHSISAFGDVSFVEAAVFLVAAGVLALLFARAERRDFHMPGSDGLVVLVAGGWATLLIFYRVFSRPAGNGYPVGIEWGFLLAFAAAGILSYAGWRMRASAATESPLRRTRRRPSLSEDDVTIAVPPPAPMQSPARPAPYGRVEPSASPANAPPSSSSRAPARKRPRFPPSPAEQLSFEDAPPERDKS
jgi:hypothetical protein